MLAPLSGCINDKSGEMPPSAGDGSVSLSVALPSPVAKSMGRQTRGAEDFDKFENLNIAMAESGTDAAPIIYSLYLEFDGSGGATTSLPGGVEYEVRDGNFGVHFSGEWFGHYGVSAEKAVFFLVGNYGEEIDAATVGDMRGLKYTSPTPGSPGYNVMYGESEDYDGDDLSHDTSADPHTGGRTLKVDLERLSAMITVKIDGSALNDNVEIIPLSIALHNVPAWNYIAKPNDLHLSDEGEWIPEGEKIDVSSQWSSVGSYDGESPLYNPVSRVVGVHFTDTEAGGTEQDPDYSGGGLDVPALFMLENLHGEGFGADDADPATGYGKRPAGAANEKEAIWNDPETATCSYLEIEAEFLEYGDGGVVHRGGSIKYRVFLGEDLAANFDVVRNTYYRFTLVLSGTGVGEDDASWRMDKNISERSSLNETDFVLNGAGEMIFVDELIAKGSNSDWTINYIGSTQGQANGGNPYLWMVTGRDGDSEWGELPLNSGDALTPGQIFTVVPESENMQFRLYVEPMTENDGLASDGYVRRVTFGLLRGDYASEHITITQYGPTVIELTGDNTPDDIEAYIASMGRSLPMTIYFDRVDRMAMPWGFDGEAIVNAGSGTQNGIGLSGNARAADYLPLGKPGSAMMHAAFMNYYQMVGNPTGFTDNTGLLPAPSIADIAAAAAGPTDPIVPNSIPSREEWKLLEMLDTAGFDVFDTARGHGLVTMLPYWTSDAVEGNNSQSWAYRRNTGSTGGFMGRPRTASIAYRMIYIGQ